MVSIIACCYHIESPLKLCLAYLWDCLKNWQDYVDQMHESSTSGEAVGLKGSVTSVTLQISRISQFKLGVVRCNLTW